MSDSINSINNNTYSSTSAGSGNLFPITINILGHHGRWVPVKCISDTGNEISIMKREVADQLGINLAGGQDFDVSGINGPKHKFKKFNMQVRIGNLRPLSITIGFAVNKGDLAENLLGNKDIVKSGKFEVKYSGNTVTYTQKAFMGKIASCDDPVQGQAEFNNNYSHLTTATKQFERSKNCGCHNCQKKKKRNDGYAGLFNDFLYGDTQAEFF